MKTEISKCNIYKCLNHAKDSDECMLGEISMNILGCEQIDIGLLERWLKQK